MNSANFNRSGLTEWVKNQHAGKLIRKSGTPYFDHLLFVAEKAGGVMPLGYEIGLCHELIENTPVTASKLHDALMILYGNGSPSFRQVIMSRC